MARALLLCGVAGYQIHHGRKGGALPIADEGRFLSMRRLSIWTACLGLVLMTSATIQNAQARTSVSVGLHFGDRYEGPEPYWRGEAQIVMVPGTRVYYVGDSDYDIYRYGRY